MQFLMLLHLLKWRHWFIFSSMVHYIQIILWIYFCIIKLVFRPKSQHPSTSFLIITVKKIEIRRAPKAITCQLPRCSSIPFIRKAPLPTNFWNYYWVSHFLRTFSLSRSWSLRTANKFPDGYWSFTLLRIRGGIRTKNRQRGARFINSGQNLDLHVSAAAPMGKTERDWFRDKTN